MRGRGRERGVRIIMEGARPKPQQLYVVQQHSVHIHST